jgi:hypothetical protein
MAYCIGDAEPGPARNHRTRKAERIQDGARGAGVRREPRDLASDFDGIS